MKSVLQIRGIVPPVPTPFTVTGAVDEGAFQRIFDHLVEGGAHGAFVLGSTGELASLSPAMRAAAIHLSVKAAAGRIPVLVGIADTCPATSADLARLACDSGADAVVAAAPYYYELTSGELQRHFHSLLPQLELPVMIYNMPWLTGHVLDRHCLRAVLEHPGVIGFKDSSGDLDYLRQMISTAGIRPDVSVLIGNDYLFLEALKLGAHGAVGGGSNIYPALFRALHDSFSSGDHASAEAAQAQIAGLGHQIFDITGRPTSVFVAIKAAMAALGLCEAHAAPPLTSCTPAQIESLRRVFAEVDRFPSIKPVAAVA